MSLIERYLGKYVQVTMDPRTLSEDELRDGPFCYVGKVAEVDEHYVFLSPADVHRPEVRSLGNLISAREVAEDLREHEQRQASNVEDFAEHQYDNDPIGGEIHRRIKGVLDDAVSGQLISHTSISRVRPC
jgi:hypothetical protein